MFNNKRSVTVTHKDAASNYVEHEISSNGMRVTSVQGEWSNRHLLDKEDAIYLARQILEAYGEMI